MIRYVTAGESHGRQLTVIIEGIPAGLKLNPEDINRDLARRQMGFGRGQRMAIEKDSVEFMGGVRLGETIGSPICMVVKNRDWENWKDLMSSGSSLADPKQFLLKPRPGHADLAGIMKYSRKDIRDVLERASARETAARVCAGAVCKKLINEFGIAVISYTSEISGIKADVKNLDFKKIIIFSEKSDIRTPDPKAEKKMVDIISKAASKGDTVGGVFTIIARKVPVGLGSYTQWDLRLDGNMARSLMSIQAIKAVEFGLGYNYSSVPGSKAHDEIFYSKAKGFYRNTNNAGGIEGGVSNGEDIVVSCVMKPIPSLVKPLRSVNIQTKRSDTAEAVRSDVCAVPAAGVVGEAAVAFELAKALKEKFGGDSLVEIKSNINAYLENLKRF
ncbi:MAG: chorismate synthase [Elusimicrobia bacterium]|nr:chorismate synthase [Elusimicrobiota bacterium]